MYKLHKKFTKGILLVVISGFLAGCESSVDALDVGLREQKDPLFGIPVQYLVFTSKVDELHILDVTVNRGNCQPVSYEHGGIKIGKDVLKFGESTNLFIKVPCNTKEIEVVTSEGDFSFTW